MGAMAVGNADGVPMGVGGMYDGAMLGDGSIVISTRSCGRGETGARVDRLSDTHMAGPPF